MTSYGVVLPWMQDSPKVGTGANFDLARAGVYVDLMTKRRAYLPGDFAVALYNLQNAASCDQAKSMLKQARIASLAMRRSLLTAGRDLAQWRTLNATLKRKTRTHNKICGRE